MNAMTREPFPGRGPQLIETRTMVEFRGRISLDADHAPAEDAGRDGMRLAVSRALAVAPGQPLEIEVEAVTLMARTGGEGEVDSWSFDRRSADGTPAPRRSFELEVGDGPRAYRLVGAEAGARVEFGDFADADMALSVGRAWAEGRLEGAATEG